MARFVDREGKKRNRSTKVEVDASTARLRDKQRKAAEKIAHGWETTARNKRTVRQVREVLSELHKEITGDEMVSLTLREHFDGFLAQKKPEVAPSTFAFYKGATERFLKEMGPRAEEDIARIERGDLTRHRNKLANVLSPSTTNHHIKALRMIFREAEREGLVLENPVKFVGSLKKEAGRAGRRAFTVDELRAVLAVASPEWQSMVLFGLYTGQRLRDVAGLRWSNLDLEKGEILLETQKTGRLMKIPMAKPLKDHIASLPAGDDPDQPVHPTIHAAAKNKGSSTLSNQFTAILAAAGLRKKIDHSKQKEGRSVEREASVVSFHSLRATAATLMHEAGVPAAIVQEMIGHDSEEVHRLYVKVGMAALQDGADKLPDLLKGKGAGNE